MALAIAKRLATAAITLLLVTLVVFGLLCALPGDPSGDDEASRPLPAEYRAALRAQYHLDDPWTVRYGRWLRDVAAGDEGRQVRDVDDLHAAGPVVQQPGGGVEGTECRG
jgi:peptide/nickel transport system permease protein